MITINKVKTIFRISQKYIERSDVYPQGKVMRTKRINKRMSSEFKERFKRKYELYNCQGNTCLLYTSNTERLVTNSKRNRHESNYTGKLV